MVNSPLAYSGAYGSSGFGNPRYGQGFNPGGFNSGIGGFGGGIGGLGGLGGFGGGNSSLALIAVIPSIIIGVISLITMLAQMGQNRNKNNNQGDADSQCPCNNQQNQNQNRSNLNGSNQAFQNNFGMPSGFSLRDQGISFPQDSETDYQNSFQENF